MVRIMKQIKKLNELYNQPFSYGIIYDMFNDNKFNDIFVALDIDEDGAHSLDVEYIYNISGLKTVSTLISGLLNEFVVDDNHEFVVDNKENKVTYDKFINEIDKKIIRIIIYHKFFLKWKNLVDTLFIDYDVTSPYNMKISDGVKFDGTVTDTKKSTYNSDGNNGGTATRNGNSSDSTYGFNSANAVPTDDYTKSDTTNENYTNSRKDTGSENNNTTKANTTKRNITRAGNIGNRSVTELIAERRKMLTYQIFDVIFSDLDSVLTRSKYI